MNQRSIPTFLPASEKEAVQIVTEARAGATRLGFFGGGSRAHLGRPANADARLGTAAMSGIAFYDPGEMVICAAAGTAVAEIEEAITPHGQMLPFEPMDHRRLFGTGGAPTVGGLVAANVSGPRRISCGAARDSLIGLRLISGRGDLLRCGGRVMKNVTGLDLVKLNCGAHGTLGLVTQATLKLLPRPDCRATLSIPLLEDKIAIAALSAALGSPYSVSAAAHLPASTGRSQALTIIRIEGLQESVNYRLAALLVLLEPFGTARIHEDDVSDELWRDVGDAASLAEPNDAALWRVGIAPSRAPDFIRRLGDTRQAHFYDWGGALVWVATMATPAAARTVRDALGHYGGHATLVRAPSALREVVDVFQPLSTPLQRLTRGIKASFDPDSICNAGRMYAGV